MCSLSDMRERFNEYQFAGKSDYARKIAGMTILAASRHGFRLGVHACIVASFFALSTATFVVYRNNVWISDMMISGGLTGALYKFYSGPKAMLRTSVVASAFFGLPLGFFFKSYLWLMDITYPEFTSRWRDQMDLSAKKRIKKEVELREKARYYASYDSQKPEQKILDHDVIVANYSDKGIVDKSFRVFNEPPDYVKEPPE